MEDNLALNPTTNDATKMNPLLQLLPPGYRRITRTLILFAAWNLIAGLVMGFVDREMQRKIPYSDVAGGYNIEASITLKLLHGHIFIMGSVIPVVMATMLIIGRIIGASEIRVRSLRISVGMYMLGIFGSLVLQFAKGIQMIVYVSDGPDLNFDHVNDKLFGNMGLRSALYAIFHILLFSGLSMFAASTIRSLRRSKMYDFPSKY